MSSVAVREYNRQWRARNPGKCAAYTKKYRAQNPDKTKARIARWQESNKEKILEYHRAWRRKNRKKVSQASKKWRTKYPERQANATKRWAVENRDKVNSNYRNRCATDPCFRLAKILRAQVHYAVTKQLAKKSARTVELTGYDLTDEAQQRACFHYTNLQPLPVSENRKKYNKVSL